MRLSDIIRSLRGIFERKRKNPVQLDNDSNLESKLKPLKVSSKNTPLHISEDTVDVKGSLKVNGSDFVVTKDTIVAGRAITGLSGGDLTLDPDGDLSFSGCDVKIDDTKKLYFDSGSVAVEHTYITESTDDVLRIVVGGDTMMKLAEKGDDGNEVNFGSTCVGFTRLEATFSATGIIGSGGTDDTDIDFRFSNKYRLEMTGDITTINLIFPSASGNFLLVCTTNGDHDVSNWKVYESDESAAITTDVLWAGGSVPAFTNNGVDIVSFYWDATEQQAYGVASLAFATP